MHVYVVDGAIVMFWHKLKCDIILTPKSDIQSSRLLYISGTIKY